MEKTVQNLRAMFSAAAEIYGEARNNEIVEFHNTEYQLKSLKLMLDIHESAHRQALAMTEHADYFKNWQRITPQGKNYDALPE